MRAAPFLSMSLSVVSAACAAGRLAGGASHQFKFQRMFPVCAGKPVFPTR